MTATELKTEFVSSESPMKKEFSSDDAINTEEGGLSNPNHVDLHRALKARHITMIGTAL